MVNELRCQMVMEEAIKAPYAIGTTRMHIKLIPCDIGFQYIFPLFSCCAESSQAIYSALRLQSFQ